MVLPSTEGFDTRIYSATAWGTWRPAGSRAHRGCRWRPPRRGCYAHSASCPFGALPWGCPWRVPLASVSGWVHCGGFAIVAPVTHTSPSLYRPSLNEGLGRCTRAILGRRRNLPGLVCVCVCLLLLAVSGGPASSARFGAPHLSLGRCGLLLLPFGPGQAGIARFFSFISFTLTASLCLWFSVVSSPWCPRPSPCVLPRPPLLFFSFFLFFFFSSPLFLLLRPLVLSGFLWFPAPVPWALALIGGSCPPCAPFIPFLACLVFPTAVSVVACSPPRWFLFCGCRSDAVRFPFFSLCFFVAVGLFLLPPAAPSPHLLRVAAVVALLRICPCSLPPSCCEKPVGLPLLVCAASHCAPPLLVCVSRVSLLDSLLSPLFPIAARLLAVRCWLLPLVAAPLPLCVFRCRFFPLCMFLFMCTVVPACCPPSPLFVFRGCCGPAFCFPLFSARFVVLYTPLGRLSSLAALRCCPPPTLVCVLRVLSPVDGVSLLSLAPFVSGHPVALPRGIALLAAPSPPVLLRVLWLVLVPCGLLWSLVALCCCGVLCPVVPHLVALRLWRWAALCCLCRAVLLSVVWLCPAVCWSVVLLVFALCCVVVQGFLRAVLCCAVVCCCVSCCAFACGLLMHFAVPFLSCGLLLQLALRRCLR